MRWSLNGKITAGLLLAIAILAASQFISYRSTDQLIQSSRQVSQTQQVLASLENILLTMDDAETGQRGYLLTGQESYLAPYEHARKRIAAVLATLDEVMPDNSERQHNLQKLSLLIKRKQRDLAMTIALKKANKTAEASRLVLSDQGNEEMDAIRAMVSRMRDREKARMAVSNALWEARSKRTTHVVVFGVEVALVFLFAAIMALNSESSDRAQAERSLRKSQARNKMLADSILDYAIMMVDREGRVLSWSLGAEKILGYTKDEMIGQSFARFFRPDDVTAGVPQRELEKVLASGRGEAEGWRVRKDGTRFWSNSVMVAIRDEEGMLQGFSKVMRDITERRAAHEEIVKLNRDLEKRATALEAANGELESFTYSVSHDLRAPLRHIDGFAQLLVDEYAAKLPEECRRYLNRIQHGARQMGELLDELLKLARIGRRKIELQMVGLDSLVEQVLDDLNMELDGRKVEWKVASLPYVRCDPTLLRQVFANLLSNAVKYTRPRAPAVIKVGSVQENGTTAIFVRDNGVGFSMKYADKLFGIFQRLHRSEDFEGTGIGLATAQRIIHKHGGRIRAEAEVDKGATFYFTLRGAPMERKAASRQKGDHAQQA